MVCFICGANDGEVKMFDVISDSGLVKVCSRCSHDVDLPIIRKSEDIKPAGEEFSVKKMKEYAGLEETSEKLTTNDLLRAKKADDLKRARRVAGVNVSTSNISFRDLVESKFESGRIENNARSDMIPHYNWEVMKVRKAKRISQEKLARDLGISLGDARKIERGVFTFEGNDLIERLEIYLGISLIKEEFRNKNKKGGIMGLNDKLTISDLNDIKKKVSEDNNPYWRRVVGKFFSKKEDVEAEMAPLGVPQTAERGGEEIGEDVEITEETVEVPNEVIFEEDNLDSVSDISNQVSGDEIETIDDEEQKTEDRNQKPDEDVVKAAKKRDLTPDEINSLIFGAKNKQ